MPTIPPTAGRRRRCDHDVFLSLASCWELAIKLRLGKLRLTRTLERFAPDQLTLNGFALLAVEFRHVARVSSLPFHHREPFDRLLVAQALEDDLALVSADRELRKYGVTVVW